MVTLYIEISKESIDKILKLIRVTNELLLKLIRVGWLDVNVLLIAILHTSNKKYKIIRNKFNKRCTQRF